MSKQPYKARCDCTAIVNGRNQLVRKGEIRNLTPDEAKVSGHMVLLNPKASAQAVKEQKIMAVINSLDKENPELWTKSGKPRMEVVEKELGKDVSRKDVEDACNKFNREVTTLSEIANKTSKASG